MPLCDALRKGPVALYFYPAAFTSSCSIEAHEFAEARADFAAMGETVIGVSADPIKKLNRFSISEFRNKFAVASADGKLGSPHKVKIPLLGKSNGTSFVIIADGRIVFKYSALSPVGHVAKTLSAFRSWRATHPVQSAR